MTEGRHSTAADRRASIVSFVSCALVACCAAPGCFLHGVNPADERQSVAEQDLAADDFKNGRLRPAFDHVQRAIKLNPDNGEASYLGAMVLLGFCAVDEKASDCRFKEAESFARKSIEASPELRDAKNALGVILVHQARYAEAVAVLKPLTEDLVYNTPESAWGNLGWAYLLQGMTAEAIEALSRSVALQPLFCVGQYRLGLAYEKKGDLSLAREALTKAVDTDLPQCKRLQDAYDARARVLARLGLKAEARTDLLRCRDMGGQTPTGQKCAAQLLMYQ